MNALSKKHNICAKNAYFRLILFACTIIDKLLLM